jgi:hypothetical protein
MTVGNSEGERRCDEKCYSAKTAKCTCICGGKNHGVGLKQAQDNVHQIAERIIADHNLKIKDHQIIMFGDTGK